MNVASEGFVDHLEKHVLLFQTPRLVPDFLIVLLILPGFLLTCYMTVLGVSWISAARFWFQRLLERIISVLCIQKRSVAENNHAVGVFFVVSKIFDKLLSEKLFDHLEK